MNRTRLAVLGAAVFALVATGCAKRVPSNIDEFSAAKRMVVTLRDGETLTGKFAEGEKVTFITFGRVYVATIEEMGPPDMILSDAYVQEEFDKFEAQRARMKDSNLYLADGTSRIVVPRYKIVDVEEITFDTMKTARGTIFWGFTTLVVIGILNSRLGRLLEETPYS